MFGERRRFAPVKEGDELDVKIEAVGEKGDGIAKKQGFVLFVPNAKTGDEVRIKVTRVLRNAGFAEVIGAAGKKPEHKPEPKQEEDISELEEASEEKDSDDFGDSDKDDSDKDQKPSDKEAEDDDTQYTEE